MPESIQKYLAINDFNNIPAYEQVEGSEALVQVSSLTQLNVVATDKAVEAVKRDLNFVWNDLGDQIDDLSDYVENTVYPEVQQKVFIKSDLTAEGNYSNLSVVKISKEDYDEMVALSGDTLNNNVLYVIDSNYEDAYGRQIKNIADAADLSDAVNKKQLDAVADIASGAVQSVELSSVDGEAADAFLKKYIIKVDGSALSPEIVIPKDKVVERGTLVSIVREGTDPDYIYKENGEAVTDPDLIAAIADVYTVDGKYVKVELQNANTIYIAVPELVDTYYAGTGLELDEVTRTFSISADYALSREQLSAMLAPVKDDNTSNVKHANDISFADIVSCLYNIGSELFGEPQFEDGTENHPWLIRSVNDLKKLKAAVEGTATADNQYGASDFYKLTKNIDMAGEEWNGIGLQSSSTPKYDPDPDHTFKGTFDGNNYVIDNLTLHCVGGGTADRYVSFFRTAGYGATIKNLTINVDGVDNWHDEDIMAAAFVGVTAGGLTVQNCTANGTLGTAQEPLDNTAGIVCRAAVQDNASITLTNVTNNVDIVSICKTGGIIAYAYGTLNFENVINTGNITRIGLDNTRDDAVAGLVGYGHQGGTHVNYNFNGVENSGTITSDLVNYARSTGQLVGKWSAMNASNTGTVTLKNDSMPLSKNIDPNIVGLGLWFGEVGADGKIHVASAVEDSHDYIFLFNNVDNSGNAYTPTVTLPDVGGITFTIDETFGKAIIKSYSGDTITGTLVSGNVYRYTVAA